MQQSRKKDKKPLWRRIFLKKKKTKNEEEGDEINKTNQDDQGGEEQKQAIHETEYDVQIVQSQSIVSQPSIQQRDDFSNNSANVQHSQFNKSGDLSQKTDVLERLNQNNESTYKSVNGSSRGSSEYENAETHEDDDGYNVDDYSANMYQQCCIRRSNLKSVHEYLSDDDSSGSGWDDSGDELASSEIEAAFTKGLMSISQYKKIVAINEKKK